MLKNNKPAKTIIPRINARRVEKKARERAIARADKDFKAGKVLDDNPYKGIDHNWAWEKRFVS